MFSNLRVGAPDVFPARNSPCGRAWPALVAACLGLLIIASPPVATAACPTITVTGFAPATVTAGGYMNLRFSQTGGSGAVTFTLASGTLPPNVQLLPNGFLTTDPLRSGAFSFAAKVTDSHGCTGISPTCTLTVRPSTDLYDFLLSAPNDPNYFGLGFIHVEGDGIISYPDYNINETVPYTTDIVTMKPILADDTASMTLNGAPQANNLSSGSFPVVVGDNVFPLRITSQDGTAHSNYVITVTRLGPAHIVVQQPASSTGTASSADLGSVHVGDTGPTLTLTIKNTGTGPLYLGTINKDGLNPGEFSFSSPLASTVLASGSTTFTARFAPSDTGPRSAVVHIASNDLATPVLDFTLTGTGIGVPHISVEEPAGTVLTSNRHVVVSGFNVYPDIPPAGLTGVQAIAVGEKHGMALKGNGTVVAWGDDTYGQVDVPAGLADVTAIAAGGHHSMALKSDGTVVAWGSNTHGESTVPASLHNVTAIAAGSNHSLALIDGNVTAWGDNSYGQCTDVGGYDAQAISARGNFNLVLTLDGHALGWGQNDYGQATVPTGLTSVKAIAAGLLHSLALKKDGTLVAWGFSSFYPSPLPTGPPDIVAIAAGDSHSAVLKSDGTATTWPPGYGPPASLKDIQAIAAGNDYTLALVNTASTVDFDSVPAGTQAAPVAFTIRNTGTADLTLGSITVDGANADEFTVTSPAASVVPRQGSTTFMVNYTPHGAGQRTAALHVYSNDSDLQPFDVRLAGTGICPAITVLNPATSTVQQGVPFSQAFTQSGSAASTVFSLASGSLPRGLSLSPSGLLSGTPAVAGTFPITVQVTDSNGCTSTGPVYTLAISYPPYILLTQLSDDLLLSSESLVAWGSNSDGQCNVPPDLVEASTIAAISAGYRHSLVLKNNGTVAAWGSNAYGQAAVPRGLSNVIAIAAGGDHSVALKSNGSVVVWGGNDFGQRTLPRGLAKITAVFAGFYHTLAIQPAGPYNSRLFAWGFNQTGQCQIPLPDNPPWAGLAAGGGHNLGILLQGPLVAWGDNRYGQCDIPASLGQANLRAVAAGGYHSLALKTGGTVTGWGLNDYGQAAPPAGLTDVRSIAAGYNHSLALKGDGTVAAWGSNESAQSSVPPNLKGVVNISAGGDHSLALAFVPTVPFPGQKTGTSSKPFTVKITNAGYYSQLLLGGFTIDGPNAGDFAASTPASSTLQQGDTTTFTLTFTPGGSGRRSAMLHIPSNDFANSPLDVKLTGTGLCPLIRVVNPRPALIKAGIPFSQTFQQSGGSAPAVFALAAGGLPPGLMLAANGIVSGTPTRAGTYRFTVKATDIYGCTGTGVHAVLVVTGNVPGPASIGNGMQGSVLLVPAAATALPAAFEEEEDPVPALLAGLQANGSPSPSALHFSGQGGLPGQADPMLLTTSLAPASGAFTASLRINGRAYAFVGQFDITGTALFGATKAASIPLDQTDQASLILTLKLTVGSQITATLADPATGTRSPVILSPGY